MDPHSSYTLPADPSALRCLTVVGRNRTRRGPSLRWYPSMTVHTQRCTRGVALPLSQTQSTSWEGHLLHSHRPTRGNTEPRHDDQCSSAISGWSHQLTRSPSSRAPYEQLTVQIWGTAPADPQSPSAPAQTNLYPQPLGDGYRSQPAFLPPCRRPTSQV